MKHRIALLLVLCSLGFSSLAQTPVPKEKMTREDKDEKNQARESRINTKNDYALFRKQVTASKEFADEKRKIPKLQTANKEPVKVIITIDSLEEGDTSKLLTGYIVQNIGDNATQMYDITYDRKLKKIVTMKKTQEAIDAEKEEKDDMAEKAAEKAGTKTTVHKKNKDDDDDDEPEEKPTKKTKDED